jgi:serine/threonine protein kinase
VAKSDSTVTIAGTQYVFMWYLFMLFCRGYKAPEIFKGEKCVISYLDIVFLFLSSATTLSDVYSLGIVGYIIMNKGLNYYFIFLF